jgi:hypothetical protein
MSPTRTGTLTERIVDCLRTFDVDGLTALYRADALLDVSVPTWRYQLQGAAAIGERLREELAPVRNSARVTSMRTDAIADGVVIEMEVRLVQAGEDRMWREVHIVHTDGAAITEHVDYCTGIWDAATIARHAIEAPMVRP